MLAQAGFELVPYRSDALPIEILENLSYARSRANGNINQHLS